MKHHPTKAEIRDEIDQQIRDYLDRGGEIQEVARGTTGITQTGFSPPTGTFDKPRAERTPVPEVVAAIDARRKPPAPPPRKPKRPRKQAVYDDFGEPVRWVWVEE